MAGGNDNVSAAGETDTACELSLIHIQMCIRDRLWDDELNSIWGRLKDKLDDDTMSKLTEDERNWIADKEAKVKAAGADPEGGSLQPLLENSEAAELTQARVYYLAQYLRQNSYDTNNDDEMRGTSSMSTVSYTHLDVYKRQDILCVDISY